MLESAALFKPIIATDIPGIREIVKDGKNGFLVKKSDVNDLKEKILKFYNISNKHKIIMGIKGRKIVENKFDENLIIYKYEKIINGILT